MPSRQYDLQGLHEGLHLARKTNGGALWRERLSQARRPTIAVFDGIAPPSYVISHCAVLLFRCRIDPAGLATLLP